MAFLFVVVAALAGCLWNVKLAAEAELCGRHVRVCLTFRLWYGLIPLRRIWRLPDDFETGAKTRRKKAKRAKFWQRLLRRATHMQKLYITGEIGAAQDAAATVLLCGALRALAAACAEAGMPIAGDIRPVFGRNACRIKVESILVFHVAHIIPAALLRVISKQRGENNHAASH